MPAPHRSSIGRLIERAPQPVYLVDGGRKIVACNRAVGQWLEIDPGGLIGRVANYHSRSDADEWVQLASALAPPPQAFQGTVCRAQVTPPARSTGSAAAAATRPPRDAWFMPLRRKGDQPPWVLGFVSAELPAADDDRAAGEQARADAAELHRQLAEWRRIRPAAPGLERFVGHDPALRAARRCAAAAVNSGADVWIVGPEGSDAEALARAIHAASSAAADGAPLVPVDCGVADAETLHAALRHLRMAPTRQARGRLLLRRIDRIHPPLAAELAGFLDVPPFDVGLISTSHVPSSELAAAGQLDEKLAVLLSTVEIRLPPLRQRPGDLPLLVQQAVEDFNAEGNRQLAGLSEEALHRLSEFEWPGDVRQLQKVVAEACRHAASPWVRPSDLPPSFLEALAAQEALDPPAEAIDLTEFLAEIENELMRRALRTARGNKTHAARLLGISRQRMIRWAELHAEK